MISPRTSRQEILDKLQKKLDAHTPIMISSAGSGLVAKLLEQAGVDCINTFCGARLRANGWGTMSMMWPNIDSNKQTLDYTQQDILPAIKGDAFICACLNPNDPLRDMRTVLQDLKNMGVESASNIGPSVSYVDKDSNLRQVLRQSGITFQVEIDMLKLTKEMDMVSVGLAFDMEDSIRMIEEAAPDVFCFHARNHQGRYSWLRLGRNDRGDGRAHRGSVRKSPRDQPADDPHRARGSDGEPGRRAIHAQPHQRERVLDGLFDRAPADRARGIGHGSRVSRAVLRQLRE